MTYTEFVHWNVVLGSQSARLSMTDARNREFFAIVPNYGERGYRDRRQEALTAIEYAIDVGMQPGEVKWQHRT